MLKGEIQSVGTTIGYRVYQLFPIDQNQYLPPYYPFALLSDDSVKQINVVINETSNNNKVSLVEKTIGTNISNCISRCN